MQTLLAIEAWGPVAAVRTSPVLYPVVSALHILGVSVLVGAVLVLDARVLGWRRDEGWRTTVAVVSPVAGAGFALAVATGGLLFAVRASRYIENPALLTKWALIGVGLINIAAFHRILPRSGHREPSGKLKACAAISATVWVGAIFAGRWIAFTV